MFRRILLRIVLLLSVAVILPSQSPVHAADFRADYDVIYSVPSEGKPTVVQQVTLTNLQAAYYPRQYTVTIDGDDLTDVTAYDSKGPITPTIVSQGGKTAIAVKFNDRVVGVGKSMKFSLRYSQPSVAKKVGSIWEVWIPGIVPDETIGEYRVRLHTSPSLGSLAYFNPKPSDGRDTWTKDQLIRGGVIATFGTTQSYNVELSYPLENPSAEPVMSDIAIPPDTAYQKVTVVSTDPKPESMQTDDDGNWIARFRLSPAEKMDVKVKLSVAVRAIPETTGATPLSDHKVLTSPQTYWETTDPAVMKLAEELKTPRAIYDYVVSTLSYDYTAVERNPERKGAKQALAKPAESVCREFTDTFIAIARAAGIPAREVVGYAYTSNARRRPLSVDSDILHAWPQYYDMSSERWIDIDPTWGHTTGGINYFDTLDFNHIAFVIRGISSEKPYPAGSYRIGSTPAKNVKVTFADYQAQELPEGVSVQFSFPPYAKSGRPYQGNVIIQNVSGQILPAAAIRIDGYPHIVSISRDVSAIPPMGTVTIPVTVPVPNWFERRPGKLLVTVNGDSKEFSFDVKPMYWLAIPVIAMAVSGFVLWSLTKKR